MSITHLPVDIQRLIIEEPSLTPSDLSSLRQTCFSIAHAVLPVQFADLTINIHRRNLKKSASLLLSIAESQTTVVKYVRCLTLYSLNPSYELGELRINGKRMRREDDGVVLFEEADGPEICKVREIMRRVLRRVLSQFHELQALVCVHVFVQTPVSLIHSAPVGYLPWLTKIGPSTRLQEPSRRYIH